MTKIKIVDALLCDWPGHVGAVYEVAEFNELGGVRTIDNRHFVKDEYEIIEEEI